MVVSGFTNVLLVNTRLNWYRSHHAGCGADESIKGSYLNRHEKWTQTLLDVELKQIYIEQDNRFPVQSHACKKSILITEMLLG